MVITSRFTNYSLCSALMNLIINDDTTLFWTGEIGNTRSAQQ